MIYLFRFPEVKSIQEEGRENTETRKHKTGKREAFKDKLRSLAGKDEFYVCNLKFTFLKVLKTF